MPWYHCRGLAQPGKVRKITEQVVEIRNEKRQAVGAQYINVVKPTLMSQRDAYYEDVFQTEMQNMRLHIKGLFTHMLPTPRIIEDVTSTRAQALLSTPLWPGNPAWKDLPGAAQADLPTSAGETNKRAKVWDFWLTDYNPTF